MQLILETETSVDVNPKMSLNEEGVEKCASDVVPAIKNGSFTNGDEESIGKCISDIVTGNVTNGECIVSEENTKSNDTIEPEQSSALEEVDRMEESELNNTDNVLEHNTDSTNNIESNDVDANTAVRNNVDITKEPEESTGSSDIHTEISKDIDTKETLVSVDIKTEISEDIDIKEKAGGGDINEEISEELDIKEEITEINNENSTELDPISQHMSEQLEQSVTNENGENPIIIKTETTENTVVVENYPMETNDTEIDEDADDLIRLDVSLKGDEFSESLNTETEKEESSTIDPKVDECSKSDDVTQMDVDTSIHIDEKQTNKMDSMLTETRTETMQSKDCELNETNSTEKEIISQPNLEPSSTDHLDEDKEKSLDSVNVETKTNLIKPGDEKTVNNTDDDTRLSKLLETEDSTNDIIDLDDAVTKDTQDSQSVAKKLENDDTSNTTTQETNHIEPVLKLSNTLDILSDDEEEQVTKISNTDNKCINIEDDDDVMLIDDDTVGNEVKSDVKENDTEKQVESKPESPLESVKVTEDPKTTDVADDVAETDTTTPGAEVTKTIAAPDISEKNEENKLEVEMKKPLIPENFLKTCKKNLADMTREELEEFCILKVVESILDRSNLSEIKNKLKTLTQNLEEYKKKAMMLTKQNRDLQVVFKSVQEDVKKSSEGPIVPLKITRSVGMQVLMSEKPDKRRRVGIGLPNTPANKQVRNPVQQGPRPQKQPTQQIPVPRLVPANSPATKSPQQQVNTGKTTSPLPNGLKSVSPVQKGEKRSHNRVQSVTVDLTDDEPPAKVVNRTQGSVPPVRLVPSQNLLAPPRPTTVNSPRKVYIPISGPQGQNIRPGQTIMLKSVPSASPRQRGPAPHMVARMPQSVRIPRPQGLRHPAPLPECMKQYQPPNWKALPPAPDLKLAKVENGIVISWKIEGYQEDSYEEIASYQLYAYQETSVPPNTALWKKIGDVKALPLPMACTLTQFMAGYKYYFAVRAVDIRSRLGPFSLPGSILLLNKL